MEESKSAKMEKKKKTKRSPAPRERYYLDKKSGCYYSVDPATNETYWIVSTTGGGHRDYGNATQEDFDASHDSYSVPPNPPLESTIHEGKSENGSSDEGDKFSEHDERARFVPLAEGETRSPSQVKTATKRIMTLYTVCLYFHACCCEAPFSFIEGIIRCLMYFTGGILLIILGVFSCSLLRLNYGVQWLREALLFFSAAVSLIIPGVAAYVYRNFDPDADWEIASIPTMIGSVDPRRFIAFSYGQGSDALNSEYDVASALDSLGSGGILHPPSSWTMARYTSRLTPVDGDEFDIVDTSGGSAV